MSDAIVVAQQSLVQRSESKFSVRTMGDGLSAMTYGELWQFSTQLSETQFVPKDFYKKPGDVMAALLYGHELGIQPMAALQNIAVVNGRPSVWGDLMLAVVQSHPAYEWHTDEWDEKTLTHTFTLKRKGNSKAFVSKFSGEDAARAKLNGKETYRMFPQRMHRHRARSYACKNAFADALSGFRVHFAVSDGGVPEDVIEADDTGVEYIEAKPVEVIEKPKASQRKSQALAAQLANVMDVVDEDYVNAAQAEAARLMGGEVDAKKAEYNARPEAT